MSEMGTTFNENFVYFLFIYFSEKYGILGKYQTKWNFRKADIHFGSAPERQQDI